MDSRPFLPIVAVIFAAFALPAEVSAQLKNTNLSRKLRSVLVGGSGNTIPADTPTAFLGGGFLNTASGERSTLGGGERLDSMPPAR